jgi:hypothetical protein
MTPHILLGTTKGEALFFQGGLDPQAKFSG